MNSDVTVASRVPQGHGKHEGSEDFEDVAFVQGESCGSAGPAPEGDDARRVRPRRVVECRHWVREALADFQQLVDQNQGRLARRMVATWAQKGGERMVRRLQDAFGTLLDGDDPLPLDARRYPVDTELWAERVCRTLQHEDGDAPLTGQRRTGPGQQASLPFGIFHASHVWGDGSWSTWEDLVAMGRDDILANLTDTPGENPGAAGTHGGIERAEPAGSVEDVQDESDASGLFQVSAGLVPSWEELIETLGRWWDAGRQVDGAIAMVRALAGRRQDRAYSRWVHGPLETLQIGFGESSWTNEEETPPDFFAWATEVEHILHLCFLRDVSRGLVPGIPAQQPRDDDSEGVQLMDDEVGKDIEAGTVHVPGKAVMTLTEVKNVDGEMEGLTGGALHGEAAPCRQGVLMVDVQAQAPQRTASQGTWRGLLGGVRRDPGRRGPRLGQVGRRAQPR